MRKEKAIHNVRNIEKPLKYLCNDDREKVCSECFHNGDHKYHKVDRHKEINIKLREREQGLEKDLQNWDRYIESISTALNKRKNEDMDYIRKGFEEVERINKLRRVDLLTQVEVIYQKEQTRIDSRLKKDSAIRRGLIERIKDHKDVHNENLWKILNEDLTGIKAEVAPSLLDTKFKDYDDDLKLYSESFIASFTPGLNKLIVQSVLNEAPSLGEVWERYNQEEATSYASFGLEYSRPLSVSIEDYVTNTFKNEKLEIAFKRGSFTNSLPKEGDWINAKSVDVSFDDLPSEESILFASFMLKRLEKLTFIALINRLTEGNGLSDLHSQFVKTLFSKPKKLGGITICWSSEKLGNEIVEFLAGEVLLQTENLNLFQLSLENTFLTKETLACLIQRLLPLEKNLESLGLQFLKTKHQEETFSNLTLNLPKLRSFSFQINCVNNFYSDLETFLVSSISSMHNIEQLDLSLYELPQEATAVLKLLDHIEKLKTLKNLKVSLNPLERKNGNDSGHCSQETLSMLSDISKGNLETFDMNEWAKILIPKIPNLEALYIGTSKIRYLDLKTQAEILALVQNRVDS